MLYEVITKISTYHKKLKDEVFFFKGNFIDFVLNQIYEDLLGKLIANDKYVEWQTYKSDILVYLKRGLSEKFKLLNNLSKSQLVGENLKYYRQYFKRKEYLDNPQWDRIYISTLFTFYWRKTIETINQFKQLCKDINEVKVGGIAASLLPNELFEATGIFPP